MGDSIMSRAFLAIDLDNMIGYSRSLGYEISPKSLLNFIKKRGDTLVKASSYGCLKNFPDRKLCDMAKEAFSAAGIEHRESLGKKNSSDLILCMDAIASVKDFDVLYILSSDKDFYPLIEKLQENDKRVVLIRMFPTPYLLNLEGLTEVNYPNDILGLNVPQDLDIKVLLYRDTIESLLKMQIPTPGLVTKAMEEVSKVYVPNIPLVKLANSLSVPSAFKILKTTLLGRGFKAEPGKNSLVSGMKSVDKLREAFYRQCFYLLKRHLDSKEVEQTAFNKAFGLREEYFNIESKTMEKAA